MRKLLSILILSICFLACKERKIKPKVKEALSPIDTSKVASPVDTIKNSDNKVYTDYISKSVIQQLKEKLPDWKLPEPAQWEDFWFKEYKKDGVLVNYISSDFNCDNKSDYAFLLQNQRNKQYAVWVVQSNDDEINVINLHEFGKAEFPLQFGIELIPKGPLSYIDFENDDPKPINLKCPGVQVVFFEKGAEAYYWKNNKYESVTTGD